MCYGINQYIDDTTLHPLGSGPSGARPTREREVVQAEFTEAIGKTGKRGEMATRRLILVLAANPKDTPPLRLHQEVQEIQAALKRRSQKISFSVQAAWAVSPRDVRRALLEHRPQIVHFCGHGSGDQGLLLESDDGTTHMVSGAALSGLFDLFADTVQCVVLNACFSSAQADAISSHVNHVVGMRREIGDKAAIEFATGFYDALGAGESVERSFRFGCNAISLAGLPGEHIPEIIEKQQRTFKADAGSAALAVTDARSAGEQLSVVSLYDLWNAGMSTKEILGKLIEMDYENLVGLDMLAEGTAEQWLAVMQNNPDGFAFVVDRAKKLIGYWHFVGVDSAMYSAILNGTLEDSDLTVDRVRFFCSPGDYNIYFVIFLVRQAYRGYRVNRMLYDAFLQRVQSFEKAGIRIVNVCANAFTPEGVGLCRSVGMRQVAAHRRLGIIFEMRLREERSQAERRTEA